MTCLFLQEAWGLVEQLARLGKPGILSDGVSEPLCVVSPLWQLRVPRVRSLRVRKWRLPVYQG